MKSKELVQPRLTRYIRDEKGTPNGCMVAAKIGGIVRIGMSKCCKSDTFSKARGRELATARMNVSRKKNY